MEQLGSQRMDFHEIFYLRIFRKSVEKIQVQLKSDKNNGQFIWKHMCTVGNRALNSSQSVVVCSEQNM